MLTVQLKYGKNAAGACESVGGLCEVKEAVKHLCTRRRGGDKRQERDDSNGE